MNKIILYIPHSSERLPRNFLNSTLIDKQKVLDFCHTIADNKTKELFGSNGYKKVTFNWSRIFCDVEKFVNPEQEIMSQFGMGVIYTNTNKGERFFNPTAEYIDRVLKKHYYPHHQKLDKVVKNALKNGSVILVDCHSFCKDIIMFKDKRQDPPDICIGYNEPTPNNAAEFAINYFKNLGYKVKENYPYSGSMVPDYLFAAPDKNFLSIMIEINKTLYLNDKKAFNTLKLQINELLKEIKTLN